MSLDKNLYVEVIDLILLKYCFKLDHLNDYQQCLYKEKHMVYMWAVSKSPSWRAGATWQLGTMKVLSSSSDPPSTYVANGPHSSNLYNSPPQTSKKTEQQNISISKDIAVTLTGLTFSKL